MTPLTRLPRGAHFRSSVLSSINGRPTPARVRRGNTTMSREGFPPNALECLGLWCIAPRFKFHAIREMDYYTAIINAAAQPNSLDMRSKLPLPLTDSEKRIIGIYAVDRIEQFLGNSSFNRWLPTLYQSFPSAARRPFILPHGFIRVIAALLQPISPNSFLNISRRSLTTRSMAARENGSWRASKPRRPPPLPLQPRGKK